MSSHGLGDLLDRNEPLDDGQFEFPDERNSGLGNNEDSGDDQGSEAESSGQSSSFLNDSDCEKVGHSDSDDDDVEGDPSILPEILALAESSDNSSCVSSGRLQNKCRHRGQRLRQLHAESLEMRRNFLDIVSKDRKLINELKKRNRELEKKNKREPRPIQPWHELLVKHLTEGSPSYQTVYKECCKQENMSTKPSVIHPNLHWNNNEYSAEDMEKMYNTSLLHQNAIGNIPPAENQLQPRIPVFRFEELPLQIQAKVFKIIFVQPSVIHCLSRLDHMNPPGSVVQFPFPCSGYSKLPHRFVFGSRSTSITTARKPSNILRPLCVSKRWLYIGVHMFYGMNTFAFSSLGEFGRFFNGIGLARAERLAHMRLQTLAVYIHESDEDRVRRRYEIGDRRDRYLDYASIKMGPMPRPGMRPPGEPFGGLPAVDKYSDDFDSQSSEASDCFAAKVSRRKRELRGCLDAFPSMMKRTSSHANFRNYRSMRTCHGMDYVYQLRGMKWVRFFDVSSGGRKNIRDWSFLEEINLVTTMPKGRQFARDSKIKHLTPLSDLAVSDEDLELVTGFYEPYNSPSQVQVSGIHDVSVDSTGAVSEFSSDSDDGSDGSGPGNFPDEMDLSDTEEDPEGFDDHMKKDNSCFPDDMSLSSTDNNGDDVPPGNFPDEMHLPSSDTESDSEDSEGMFVPDQQGEEVMAPVHDEPDDLNVDGIAAQEVRQLSTSIRIDPGEPIDRDSQQEGEDSGDSSNFLPTSLDLPQPSYAYGNGSSRAASIYCTGSNSQSNIVIDLTHDEDDMAASVKSDASSYGGIKWSFIHGRHPDDVFEGLKSSCSDSDAREHRDKLILHRLIDAYDQDTEFKSDEDEEKDPYLKSRDENKVIGKGTFDTNMGLGTTKAIPFRDVPKPALQLTQNNTNIPDRPDSEPENINYHSRSANLDRSAPSQGLAMSLTHRTERVHKRSIFAQDSDEPRKRHCSHPPLLQKRSSMDSNEVEIRRSRHRSYPLTLSEIGQ
ncbi:hypothetical protein BX600DRAFT_436166 [Xylariales sp. PMI_506]|nr:hypothetical protein BX600DRAFT_436166 [Xylariales sp. PMI_506]